MANKLSALLETTFETTAGDKTLADLLADDRPTVFVGYPMDFTSVCTKQLCSYRDDWSELSTLPIRWWGINQSPVKKHERFKAEHSLPFDLVTDRRGKLLAALGLKSLVGTKRGFTVVSPDGGVLGRTSVFPVMYQRTDEVMKFLKPLVESA